MYLKIRELTPQSRFMDVTHEVSHGLETSHSSRFRGEGPRARVLDAIRLESQTAFPKTRLSRQMSVTQSRTSDLHSWFRV